MIVDPDRLNAAKLTLEQVSDALKATNQVTSVGRLPKDYRQYLVLADRRAHEPRRRAQRRGGVPEGNAALPGRHRRGARGRRRSHDADHRQRTAGGGPDRRPPDPRQHPRRRRRRRAALDEYRAVAAAAIASEGRLRPRDVRPRAPWRACATRSSSAACWRSWCCWPSCATGASTSIAATSLPLTHRRHLLHPAARGGTINLMSLGGLAIAIGLVIDDAIVVVENIHRHRAPARRPRRGRAGHAGAAGGRRRLDAHHRGRVRAAGAATGVVGQFFAALSLTLAAAVLLSLGYALLFIPVPAARFLRPQGERRESSRLEARASATARFCVRARAGRGAWRSWRRSPSRRSAPCFYLPPRDRLPAGDGRRRLRDRLL